MTDPTTDPPDLRTLAAEALARSAGSPAFAPQVANDPHWNRPRHELQADADAVLAAVLPAHRDMVLAEAMRACVIAINQDHQRYGHTKSANGIYDICRTIVRETIQRLAATTPADSPASTEPAENAPAAGREAASPTAVCGDQMAGLLGDGIHTCVLPAGHSGWHDDRAGHVVPQDTPPRTAGICGTTAE